MKMNKKLYYNKNAANHNLNPKYSLRCEKQETKRQKHIPNNANNHIWIK